jgi:hypothetical protein
MHRLLASFAILAAMSLTVVEYAQAEPRCAGLNEPGGCWHYGHYYNPAADYGPYYRGVRKPLLKWSIKYLTGVPYQGYYYGRVPGAESRRPGCPYSAQFGGMPSISSTYPGMEYITRRSTDASNAENIDTPITDPPKMGGPEIDDADATNNPDLQSPSVDSLGSPNSIK